MHPLDLRIINAILISGLYIQELCGDYWKSLRLRI